MKLGIVVLDTLRYDVCRQEMPRLRGLANHEYERMYSTARWTPPAHASLFTGLYPTEVGVHAGNRRLSTPVRTLPERLQGAGYETVMLSNNVHLDPFFDFDRGFDAVHRGPALSGRPTEHGEIDWDELSAGLDDGFGKYLQACAAVVRSDGATLGGLWTGLQFVLSNHGFLGNSPEEDEIDWAITALDDLAVPDDFFLFANLMPCHYPYHPPEGYRNREPLDVNPLALSLREDAVTAAEHERQWETYRGAARYLDDAVPELLALVDWDLLFVLSDHGELFGEYGGLRGHQYGVYPELIHVPAFAIGERAPSGTTSRPTSILDVHGTISAVAGVQPDADSRGENLLAEKRPPEPFAYAESTGCFERRRGLREFESEIPPGWDEPHYSFVTDEALLVSDKDGKRVLDAETDEPRSDDGIVERVTELRTDRADYTGAAPDECADSAQDVPGEIDDRLEALGYR